LRSRFVFRDRHSFSSAIWQTTIQLECKVLPLRKKMQAAPPVHPLQPAFRAK
jgi:hypothetical protein